MKAGLDGLFGGRKWVVVCDADAQLAGAALLSDILKARMVELGWSISCWASLSR